MLFFHVVVELRAVGPGVKGVLADRGAAVEGQFVGSVAQEARRRSSRADQKRGGPDGADGFEKLTAVWQSRVHCFSFFRCGPGKDRLPGFRRVILSEAKDLP